MKVYKRDWTHLKGKPRCPACDMKIDGFTPVDDKKAIPKEGDISVCVYCATPLTVKGNKWARLEGKELDEAMADKKFSTIVAMVRVQRKLRRN